MNSYIKELKDQNEVLFQNMSKAISKFSEDEYTRKMEANEVEIDDNGDIIEEIYDFNTCPITTNDYKVYNKIKSTIREMELISQFGCDGYIEYVKHYQSLQDEVDNLFKNGELNGELK